MELTTYETIKLTSCEVVRKCTNCGRIRTFYCEDKDFKFCDKCGKLVINNLTEDEDRCFSCPYYDPTAPDCCTYNPESCYYDEEE